MSRSDNVNNFFVIFTLPYIDHFFKDDTITSRTPIKSAEKLRNVMKLPESKWSAACYVFIFTAIIYTSVEPPSGLRECVNGLFWLSECVKMEKKLSECVKINFLIARMRESALFLRKFLNFSFSQIFKYFPDLSENFSRFPKKLGLHEFPEKFAWMRELRKRIAWMREIWVHWGASSVCTTS